MSNPYLAHGMGKARKRTLFLLGAGQFSIIDFDVAFSLITYIVDTCTAGIAIFDSFYKKRRDVLIKQEFQERLPRILGCLKHI